MKITIGTYLVDCGDGSYRTVYLASSKLADELDDLVSEHIGDPVREASGYMTIEVNEIGQVLINNHRLPETLEEAWEEVSYKKFPLNV